ncbi:hypothetical protein DH2020_008214 [Rehmannia glutinosa]|uniref:Tripeptidyl-peptidase II n=1 Tax=Rehmannia glutinosa TaxID=99300 RepID=A0ABR0U1E3_REHGL
MELPNVVALILFSLFIFAHNVHQTHAERSTYIVHMDKSTMPKAFSSHHYWYSSILKPSPGFISAYADDVVTPDTTHSYKFLSLNTATGLWPASAYGKDVIIGVIDTGIWPESPSFKDDGMTEIPSRWKGVCQSGQEFNSSLCNKKIIGARYFNEGFRADAPDIPITMNSARDVDGHGTHVSSIAAGNYVNGVSFFGYATGTARGVAPRARLAVYKVLWGGGVSSDILAGIDQAVADGVDIISISIGTQEINLYENPLSIASFGAREKGILVCLSAGNRGPSVRTIRSGIPWAVVVASGTIDRWLAGILTLGNRKTITGWTTFPARATIRNLPLVYNETLSVCDSSELLAQAPAQSIIVCNLTISNTDFDGVMSYLPNSNVRAAIVIAEDPRIFRFNLFPFPGVVISPTEARELTNYVSNSDAPTATIDFQQTILGTEPRAARPYQTIRLEALDGYEGILKPDLMAPGVSILAAHYPHAIGPRIGNNIFLSTDYTLLSGTSMACPHISGTAALLKAAHPDWSPAAIQSAMMTTANHLDNTNQPIKDMVDYTAASPLGIGSGMVDPNARLIQASFTTRVHAGLGESRVLHEFHSRTNSNHRTIELQLLGSIVRPELSALVAIFNFAERGMMLTRRFQRTVTNVGDGAATYKVKVEVPVNTTMRIRPQNLVFRKKYEKLSYSLTIRYRADIDNQHRDGSVT